MKSIVVAAVALLVLAGVARAQTEGTQPPNSVPPSTAGTLLCHFEPTTGLWELRRVRPDQVEARIAQGDTLAVLGTCEQPKVATDTGPLPTTPLASLPGPSVSIPTQEIVPPVVEVVPEQVAPAAPGPDVPVVEVAPSLPASPPVVIAEPTEEPLPGYGVPAPAQIP